MTRHVELGPATAIPKGEGRNYRIGAFEIAVFRTRDGRVFATQAACPHRGGPLADGLLGGATLVCPLHEWTFDLNSGMSLNGTCGLRMYPVTQRADGALVLEIEDDGAPPPWRVTDYSKA